MGSGIAVQGAASHWDKHRASARRAMTAPGKQGKHAESWPYLDQRDSTMRVNPVLDVALAAQLPT